MNVIAQAIREYGQAIRGDWGSIDGRSVRIEMNKLADAVEEGNPSHRDIQWWRNELGICPHGCMHWTMYCEDYPSCEQYSKDNGYG